MGPSVQRRESGLRFLIRFMAILLSIWTFLAVLLWGLFRSMDQALLGRSPSPADTLTLFAVPAVGWILVIGAWVTTERPWRNRDVSADDEDGVWVGNTYLPSRPAKD